jgi:hypothetical protein
MKTLSRAKFSGNFIVAYFIKDYVGTTALSSTFMAKFVEEIVMRESF